MGIGSVRLYSDEGELLLAADGIELRAIHKADLPEPPPESGDAAQGTGVGRALILDLAKTDPAGARSLLGQRLLERVAAVMAHAPEDIDVDAPLTELGFDSLMAMRAKGIVEDDLGIELQPKVLLQGGCLADLEDVIATELGLGEAGPRGA